MKKIEDFSDRELLENIFYQNRLINHKLSALLGKTEGAWEIFHEIRTQDQPQLSDEIEIERILFKESVDTENLTDEEKRQLSKFSI